jgi:pimeloyl-ACP methyl ester carboxylesterase
MRPEVVAGVVLNDVGPEVAPEGVARIRQYVGKLPPVSSWEEAANQAETIYGAALPHIDDWEAYARLGYRENDAGVPVLDMDPDIGTAARELEGTAPDLWPVFGALAGRPVLVLRGETSDILSVATLEKMQSTVPGLEAVTVPGCGHAPTLDEPECIEAIDRLLSKTES